MIYLIGLLYKDPSSNTWILKQYFANSMDREKELLEKFMYDLSFFDKIITYNGDSFDLPFIEHRLEYYRLQDPLISREKSFDLYRIIRENQDFLDLENLKLKTIEESLGFFREDIYSGYDCIGFYYEYLNSKDRGLKEKILRHNYDDLVHMLDIITILDVLDKKKSFHIQYGDSSRSFQIRDIQFIGDMMNIRGSIDLPLEKDIKYYAPTYNITTSGLDSFKISMEYKEGYISQEEKSIYIDLLDFQPFKLRDKTDYQLPENIFLLRIEKKYLLDNLHHLFSQIFQTIIIK